MTPVVLSRHPFCEPVAFTAPTGSTVLEIVKHAIASNPGMPEGFHKYCVARIGEHEIPRHNWHLVRPINGSQVNIGVRLHGGDQSTSKQVLTVVAAIAITVATVYVGGPAFAATALGTALGTTGIIALQVGIGLAGSLALYALAPPPVSGLGSNAGGSSNALGSAGADGANQLSPLQQVPTVVGKMRVAPAQITPVWVENEGDDQVAYLVCGLAGRQRLTNPWVKGASIANSDAFTYTIFDGNGGPPTLSGFPRVGMSIATGHRMKKYAFTEDDTADAAILTDQTNPNSVVPEWNRVTGRSSPDEIHLNLQFPIGINRQNADYKYSILAVQTRIRRRGTTAWRMLPSILFGQNNEFQQTAFRRTIKLIFAPYVSKPIYADQNARPFSAVRNVPADATSGAPEFNADPYFGTGSGTVYAVAEKCNLVKGAVEIYLDPTNATPANQRWAKDFYEIETIRSPIMAMPDGGVYPGTIHTNPWVWTQSGKKVGPKGSGADRHSSGEVVLENITSIWNQAPVQTPGVAVIAVKAKNESIEQLTVEAESYASTWNGSVWSAAKTTTSNPASLLREVMLGSLNPRPIPADLLDDANLGAWYTHCNSNSLQCNLLWDAGTAEQLMQAIAAAGHAAIRRFDKWGVIIEKSRASDTPVQTFTNRNIRNLKVDKSFPFRTQAIRATYNDRSANWEIAEQFVYDTGFNAGNVNDGRIDAMEYPGITSSAEITKRARLDMRQARLRQLNYSFETSIEFLVATRGSLVNLQHDTLSSQVGSARIVEVLTSGSNITGMVLDQPLPLGSITGNRGVVIRIANGSSATTITKQVSEATETYTVTFTTPFTTPVLTVDNLVTAGPLNTVMRRCIVYDIQPKEDWSAQVTLVDEAPGIHPL